MNNCFHMCLWANKVMSFVQPCQFLLFYPETSWDYGLEMETSLNSLQLFVWKCCSSNICPGSFSTKWYPWSHPCMGPYEPLGDAPFILSHNTLNLFTCGTCSKEVILGHSTQFSILLCLNLVEMCCWYQIQNKHIFTKLAICTWNILSLHYIHVLHIVPKCRWIQ